VGVHGGHRIDTRTQGELRQCIIAGGVKRMVMVPEFNRNMIATERIKKPVQLLLGRRRT
jgi:hypothetical protein